jgi:hypothetical protein
MVCPLNYRPLLWVYPCLWCPRHEHPIIILLDSRASHDFMSSACAKRTKLTFVALGVPYVISTPGGQVDADV